MLIITFLALSFLGIFAIQPTLSTITDLQKQLEDSNFVYEKLTTKMENLQKLQEQYLVITDDLPFVFDAIPQTPTVPPLVGQIEAIAKKSGVKINTLRVNKVLLNKNIKAGSNTSKFSFTIETEGTYENLTKFATSLTFFNRLVNIESISILKDPRRDALTLTVKGIEYFKP
jgi:Tfp pilus assembly protein PilO